MSMALITHLLQSYGYFAVFLFSAWKASGSRCRERPH